ncbi:MAG: hypothetical protein DRQ47_00530 [Gammaproteobacteria bacterium]|nr:MAG: hypothetical protein DRQ47_00530 [Gammaproteobacteria bacterium]
MQAKTALVVDDSRVARMTLSKLLKSHGLEVAESKSAEDALEILQSGTPHPSIIFMDVMMEGMDGLTATTQLKADENTKHIPVVICTGNDSEADRGQALSTGAMGVLSKPAEPEELTSILATLEEKIEPLVETTSMAPVIDEEAIYETVLIRVKTDLLPEMQREMREMVEALSQQVAGTAVEEMIKESTGSLVESISEQVIETSSVKLKQVVGEVAEELVKEQTGSLAEDITLQAMEAATNQVKQIVEESIKESSEDIDSSQRVEETAQRIATEVTGNYLDEHVPEKITQLLEKNGAAWLEKQESRLIATVTEKVNAEAISTVLAYLETEMEPLVTPVVKELVQGGAQPQQDNTSKSLQKKLGLFGFPIQWHLDMLTGAVIGLGTIVLILIIVLLAT